jgi:hypothetical protein
VLGTPPALILSQDQTLQLKSKSAGSEDPADTGFLGFLPKGMNLGTRYLVFKDPGNRQ